MVLGALVVVVVDGDGVGGTVTNIDAGVVRAGKDRCCCCCCCCCPKSTDTLINWFNYAFGSIQENQYTYIYN